MAYQDFQSGGVAAPNSSPSGAEGQRYAQAEMIQSDADLNDIAPASAASTAPVGHIQEISGEAIITRTDGHSEPVALGQPVYQGDVIETQDKAAVNIVFSDESSFAISEGAKLAIDEYVFDPATEAGETNVSILKGIFVFTSGLIGREDPDSVKIETPAGSIGIRGTIIAGNINTGEITVVEGAIVLRNAMGQEVTLSNQFETARFDAGQAQIEHMGQISAEDVANNFASISGVAPSFFTSIEDSAAEAPEAQDENAHEDDGENGDQTTPDADASEATGDDASAQPVDDGSQPQAQAQPAPQTVTAGFGLNTGLGLGNGGLELSEAKGLGTLQPAAGSSGMMTANVGFGTDAGQIIFNPTAHEPAYDPNAHIVPNLGPVALGQAEDFFFRASDTNPNTSSTNTNWSFDFKGMFNDPDGTKSGLSYDLSDASKAALSNSGITAQFVDGVLTLSWTNAGVTPGDFTLEILVSDGHGGYVTQTYTFQVLDTIADNDGIIDSTQDGLAIRDPLSGFVIDTIHGDSNHIFFNDLSRNVTVNGHDNTIYSGNGADIFTLNSTAVNTTISGGAGEDKVVISDLGVFTSTRFDGGADFDSLLLNVAGNIDFTQISDNQYTNIEMINADNGIAQNITLSLQDMLAMTDQNHDLFINIDTSEGDTFNLLGYDLSNMSYITDTINSVVYNIYQIDGVTLYLNTDNT
ncbi:MAG: FecR domain-containing protein [Alphaproteobacteria bacterium]|nr:FecR domain-containing protein [Alphaproteobacteria bacterium]